MKEEKTRQQQQQQQRTEKEGHEDLRGLRGINKQERQTKRDEHKGGGRGGKIRPEKMRRINLRSYAKLYACCALKYLQKEKKEEER